MDQPAAGKPNGHVSIEAPTNNGYGEDNKLIAASRAANAAGDVAGGNSTAPEAGPADPLAAAMTQAQGHQPMDLLAPTDHPDEPVTAGLPVGAGAGPEILGRTPVPRVTKTLDLLAGSSNNPVIASLAGEAASRNL